MTNTQQTKRTIADTPLSRRVQTIGVIATTFDNDWRNPVNPVPPEVRGMCRMIADMINQLALLAINKETQPPITTDDLKFFDEYIHNNNQEFDLKNITSKQLVSEKMTQIFVFLEKKQFF